MKPSPLPNSIHSALPRLSFWKIFATATLLLSFVGVRNSEAVLWGNIYDLGNSNTSAVNPTSTQWVTFTATEDMEISGARIYNSSGITNFPEIVVDIRAVDGGGLPTGAVLGSGTFSPTGTGFQAVALPDVALTSGQVYAMEVSSATVGASYPWRLNIGATGGIQPFGDPDPNFLRGQNATGPFDGTMVWVLDTDIGRTVGQPYVSATAQNVASTTSTVGQRFRFDQTAAGGNDKVESIRLRLGLGRGGGSPLDPPTSPVTVKLIDATGAVLATAARDLSGEPVGSGDYTFDLNTPISLTDGDSYYIGLYSNGSAGNTVTWFGWNTVNDADYISSTFQGANANAISFSSQTDYTGIPTELVTRDYAFGLNVIPEPSSLLLLLAGGGTLLATRRRRVLA